MSCSFETGRCVQSGIDDITSDDSWALYLDKLNEVIWPDGKLAEDAKKPKSEIEKSRTRKDAVQALMDAFPGGSIIGFMFILCLPYYREIKVQGNPTVRFGECLFGKA